MSNGPSKPISVNGHEIRVFLLNIVSYFNVGDALKAAGLDASKAIYPPEAYCDINLLWDLIGQHPSVWKACNETGPFAAPGATGLIYR